MIRTVAVMCAVVLLGATWSAPSVGPVRGTLQGRLLDARNGDPIPGAEVTLIVSRMTRITGVDGRFSFGDHDVTGPDTVVIRHIAYDSMRLSIDRDLGPLDLELDLAPSPIPLEGLHVSVRAARAQEEARYLARLSDGALWEREEFERYIRSARHVVDPLRWSGKVMFISEDDEGYRCVQIRVSASHGCALILLNNVRVSEDVLLAYSPDEIESYVIIGPVDATTLYGTGASGGVVVLYTRGRD